MKDPDPGEQTIESYGGSNHQEGFRDRPNSLQDFQKRPSWDNFQIRTTAELWTE